MDLPIAILLQRAKQIAGVACFHVLVGALALEAQSLSASSLGLRQKIALLCVSRR